MSNTILTTDPQERKNAPVGTGVLDYFPDALMEVAKVSLAGNRQHGLGHLHWDRSKSTDESDALIRHFMERDKIDTDGMYHAAKMVWRGLAYLQKKVEADKEAKAKSSVTGQAQCGQIDVSDPAGEFKYRGELTGNVPYTSQQLQAARRAALQFIQEAEDTKEAMQQKYSPFHNLTPQLQTTTTCTNVHASDPTGYVEGHQV